MKFSVSTILFGLVATSSAAAIEKRTPPNIPSASSAKTMLASIPVRTTDATGYQRSLFPHWITISGQCNTRETVLNRDGTNLSIGSDCYPDSGTWFSVYDGATWTQASDLDIDHVVPLSDAWKSGANTWTTAKRQDFANDLTNPQLIAVTDTVNQAKGDKSPDAWKPPLTSYHCTYARMWVKVKSVWGLSVTAPEKSALTSMLNTC
ncbi:hypothetical protein BZA77DRAFT_273993 [Pyronema omphalodes]|nr:hypothetical protein BZA77DRAFT_273993 [Pyronema omphalodes]